MKKVYDNEFKTMIVNLLNSGRTAKELSSEYDIEYSSIHRWKREFRSKSGDFSKKKVLTPVEQELRLLKKELKDTKVERDILKKAVSIFSKSDN